MGAFECVIIRTERKKTRRGTERLDLGEAADKRLEDGVARAVLVRNADGNGELVNVAQSLKHRVVLAPPLPRIRTSETRRKIQISPEWAWPAHDT